MRLRTKDEGLLQTHIYRGHVHMLRLKISSTTSKFPDHWSMLKSDQTDSEQPMSPWLHCIFIQTFTFRPIQMIHADSTHMVHMYLSVWRPLMEEGENIKIWQWERRHQGRDMRNTSTVTTSIKSDAPDWFKSQLTSNISWWIDNLVHLQKKATNTFHHFFPFLIRLKVLQH